MSSCCSGCCSARASSISSGDQRRHLAELLDHVAEQPLRAPAAEASARPASTSMFVRRLVSGVRSSCEASATSWRWARLDSSSAASIVLKLAASRRELVVAAGLDPLREVAGLGHALGRLGQAPHGRERRLGDREARAPAATSDPARRDQEQEQRDPGSVWFTSVSGRAIWSAYAGRPGATHEHADVVPATVASLKYAPLPSAAGGRSRPIGDRAATRSSRVTTGSPLRGTSCRKSETHAEAGPRAHRGRTVVDARPSRSGLQMLGRRDCARRSRPGRELAADDEEHDRRRHDDRERDRHRGHERQPCSKAHGSRSAYPTPRTVWISLGRPPASVLRLR